MDSYLELGVIALVIAYLVGERIWQQLRARGVDLQRMARQVENLHRWHDVADTNGVPRWYVRQEVYQSLHDLLEVSRETNEILRQVARDLQRLVDALDKRHAHN